MSAIALQIEWQVGGGSSEPTLTRLTTAFERAGAELAQVGKHILPKLLPVLEVQTAKQFDAQGGGPQAGSWAPLSVSYAKWKAANYPGQPINVLTGVLRAALTDSSSANAERTVNGDALSFGTRGLPYASVKQTGGRNEPARPPFDFGSDMEQAIQQAAAAGVRDAVREASAGLLDFEGDTYVDESGTAMQVLTGRAGGRYVVKGGRNVYLKRRADGSVVERRRGGKR